MGKHQWLENGNLLITESTNRRAFELTPDGDIAWEYVYQPKDEKLGTVEEAQRLSPEFTADFFAARRAACSNFQAGADTLSGALQHAQPGKR